MIGPRWSSSRLGGTIRMTPTAFIAKWQNSALKERAAAQEHFLDLCRIVIRHGIRTPLAG